MGTKISIVEYFWYFFFLILLLNNKSCFFRFVVVFAGELGPSRSLSLERKDRDEKNTSSSTKKEQGECFLFFALCVNDPSAGSPTETLLRLLLPLNDKVYLT